MTTTEGELFAADLVRETAQTQPSGGRPSRLLSLNPDFALIIAVDIGENGGRADERYT